jgi:hypothetical protein
MLCQETDFAGCKTRLLDSRVLGHCNPELQHLLEL